MDFAFCNRSLMMQRIQEVLADALPGIAFEPMINIAHNYAAIENHFGENVFVHRKGAAVHDLSLEKEMARLDALGIIHALRYQKDLEEAPGAYKDIDEVMANQQDLVRILTELSPVAVIKGV